MVEVKSKLHFILDTHKAPYTILTASLKGVNGDRYTDEQIEA